MEVVMKRCTFEYHTGQLSLTCHPNAVSFDPQVEDVRHVRTQISGYLPLHNKDATPSDAVIWQRPPGQRFKEASRLVIGLCHMENVRNKQHVIMNKQRADGVILCDPSITVAVTSRDCPYLILWSEQVPRVAVLHCGRDQLHNVLEGRTDESVIANAIPWFGVNVEPDQIYGAMVMGIAPEHFANAKYPKITTALSRRWGLEVIPDQTRHTIDLKELILRQLESYRIPRANIMDDGIDTFSNKYCASYRDNRGGHNLILVSSRKDGSFNT